MAWILAVFTLVLVLDQITKALVLAYLETGQPIRDQTFFQLSHQRNEGLIGGLFRERPWVTYLAPAGATVILMFLFRRLDAASRLQSLAYGMVLGGAIGNLVDRIRLQSVTDFLQFNFYFIPFDFPWKLYPAFNIADSGICIGVALLVFGWNSGQPEHAASTV